MSRTALSGSVRGRLVTAAVAVTSAAVIVLVVGVQLLLGRLSAAESLDLLRARADAAASTVRVVGGTPTVLETPSDSLDQNLWVYAVDGRLVDGAVPPEGLRSAVHRLGLSGAERSVVADGRYRLLARPVLVSGRPVAVVVAGVDLAPYESSEQHGLWLSLVLGLLAVTAAGAASWVTAGSALRRVRLMARRADDWREHDLTGRFDLPRPGDELTALGDTLDRMLDRIAQAIHAERRLTDEVAHELRTPLAVIRSEAQLALASTIPGTDREALDNIVAATDRMDASIATMLAVARSTHADEGPCDPRVVLAGARDHAPSRHGVRVAVRLPGDDVSIGAPERVVVAALGPLVENAVRHAKGSVVLTAERRGRRVVLIVRDDGPGVPARDLARVFEPGRSSHPGNAGLGLALAARLARSVGGEVRAEAGPGGAFVLDLPVA